MTTSFTPRKHIQTPTSTQLFFIMPEKNTKVEKRPLPSVRTVDCYITEPTNFKISQPGNRTLTHKLRKNAVEELKPRIWIPANKGESQAI